MKINDELKDIMSLVFKRRGMQALERLHSFSMKFPELNAASAIEEIERDFSLMSDYWRRGIKDDKLSDVYTGMLRRIYVATANLAIAHGMNQDSYASYTLKRVNSIKAEWSVAELLGKLQDFTSEVSMLQSEPENKRAEKQFGVYSRHQALMNDWFDFIWTSRLWSDSFANEFVHLFEDVSEGLSADCQMLVSAVTLSNLNVYDFNKFKFLCRVYRSSTDRAVAQRALVGWVLSLRSSVVAVYPAVRDILADMLDDDKVRADLDELQMQIVYCVNTEKDSKTIQKEIMPDLIKNSNLKMTLNGIEEREDDPMQDILNPGEAERNMERMEEGFRRMMDMRKQGADIYFGGFAQMKRFPFFSQLSNWFVPFYKEHPAVSGIISNGKMAKFFDKVVVNGLFCNSDKYSFVLAFNTVLSQLPENMRTMLEQDGAPGAIGGEADSDELSSDSYVRRIYLQDLYRFFRLNPSRAAFANPFDYRGDDVWQAGYVYYANPVFRGTSLEKGFTDVASFMLKRGMFTEAAEVLDNCSSSSKDYLYYMLCGNVLLRKQTLLLGDSLKGLTAAQCFRNALKHKAGDIKALAGLARAAFYDDDFETALDIYGQLLENLPDNDNFLLSRSICLVNLGRYNDALPSLFKLNYENPDNRTVSQVLARSLTGVGRFGQARDFYNRLEEAGDVQLSDYINHGLCEWFDGAVEAAAVCFAEYLKRKYRREPFDTVVDGAWKDIVEAEHDFILANGIGETDMQLMVDYAAEIAVGRS